MFSYEPSTPSYPAAALGNGIQILEIHNRSLFYPSNRTIHAPVCCLVFKMQAIQTLTVIRCGELVKVILQGSSQCPPVYEHAVGI
jgi:hypothetical protein